MVIKAKKLATMVEVRPVPVLNCLRLRLELSRRILKSWRYHISEVGLTPHCGKRSFSALASTGLLTSSGIISKARRRQSSIGSLQSTESSFVSATIANILATRSVFAYLNMQLPIGASTLTEGMMGH